MITEAFLRTYLGVAGRIDDARTRLGSHREDGLTSVEIAVIVGLLVAAAIAIIAIIRNVGESAASDIKYK